MWMGLGAHHRLAVLRPSLEDGPGKPAVDSIGQSIGEGTELIADLIHEEVDCDANQKGRPIKKSLLNWV